MTKKTGLENEKLFSRKAILAILKKVGDYE